jgi:hypothetical protein
MSKTTKQLAEIISAGGCIKIDIKSRAFENILELAAIASLGKGGLLLTNAEKRTTKQLLEIASLNNHKIFS